MSIKYIQFRSDVVVAVGGATRSFNAWTPDKHGDFCEPEELPNGSIMLHAIETHTVYGKGVPIKERRRTGKHWKVHVSALAYVMYDDDVPVATPAAATAPPVAAVKAKA